MISTHPIFNRYKNSEIIEKIITVLKEGNRIKFNLRQISGSIFSFFNAAVFSKINAPMLIIMDDKEQAAYVFNELEDLLGQETSWFFPSSFKHLCEIEETDYANVLLRARALDQLKNNLNSSIIVTYPEALLEKVFTQSALNSYTLALKVNDSLSIDFINETLFEYRFKRVDFVTQPGEFSIRGGIVDVFSFSNNQPYRVEFFGDIVESIRTFDIDTQLSVDKKNEIYIIPNIENKFLKEPRESFFKYLLPKAILSIQNIEWLLSRIENDFEKVEKQFKSLTKESNSIATHQLFINKEECINQLKAFSMLEFNAQPYFHPDFTFTIESSPQPSFNKQFNLFAQNLIENTQNGLTNYLCCSSEKQKKRLEDIFQDTGSKIEYKTIVGNIFHGFVDRTHRLACYTDHQIFERYHRFKLKRYSQKQAVTIKELNHLKVGDYVTHIDHGIGKFGGLMKIENNGRKQEAIKLIYQDHDILYVNIHSLYKIAKYNSKDGAPVKVNKLGSPAWKNLKNKTKKKAKEIAFDLIKLYAKRRANKGFAFSPDTYLQNELEASFIFEDTPDQLKATQAIKDDMESERVMDRLICGDVGFGKTEIAIRAAFKAATDGKQVAVLVPTTLLAFQHYRSFSRRLEEMPIRVDYINRFRTSKERRLILEDLKDGKIDIIIGTNQLAAEKTLFKDLGLLIIDEEHKLGVKVKDQLKTFRENVDTLTLTATPIPRTLQFSLMAARDLSVMKTPPPNRQPVDTQRVNFSEEVIREAVFSELSRGGQVFFIHNRIENIAQVASMIQRLVPDARIAVGHGQMEGKKLEKLMLDFIEARFDVLVSTTIVESGLDIPNANTMIINQAQHFGLADLHQLRGRVGRANKRAFCYLITPPYSKMTEEARRRLQAVEQFSDLGAGFNIAMKDLEIRGAGNLLGGEQSGFIHTMGFDTYQKILNEAIEELKETEFKELFKGDKKSEDQLLENVSPVTIDTDFELLIPDDYVNDVEERLVLYHELNQLKNAEELQKYTLNLIDRFGQLPFQVNDLFKSLQLKWLCHDLGIEKIVLKNNVLLAYFIQNIHSSFYESGKFQSILEKVQTKYYQLAQLKEKSQKDGSTVPMLRFDRIHSIDNALEIIKEIGV